MRKLNFLSLSLSLSFSLSPPLSLSPPSLQVGLASLTGLAYCILLIPINCLLDIKIGKLSTLMTAQKDNRVKVSLSMKVHKKSFIGCSVT